MDDDATLPVLPGITKAMSPLPPDNPGRKTAADSSRNYPLPSSIPGRDPFSEIVGGFPMDEAVLELLPSDAKVISAEPSGNSFWAITGKVTAILKDGAEKCYLLKCANGSHGRIMLLGEFTSVTVIHSLFPDMVPTPYGWGKFRTPNGGFERYFFLSEFLDTDLNAPDPEQFATAIAALHKKGTSPNGMFGFPVTTCHGNLSHPIEWESSWSVFFTKLLKAVLKLDSETNGVWPELEAAAQQLFTGVVPRLLNALQSNGRQIKPSLIHGDLWEGNVGTLMENGEIILYNACSYYAHNEMELGIWRCEWGQFFRNRIYYNRYFSRFPPAEPRDEWEDRNRLYSLKYNLIYTAGHLGSVTRKTAYNDILYLCEKYAPLKDLEVYDPENDISTTGVNNLQVDA